MIRRYWKEGRVSFENSPVWHIMPEPDIYTPIREEYDPSLGPRTDVLTYRLERVHRVCGRGYRIDDQEFYRVTCEGIELALEPIMA